MIQLRPDQLVFSFSDVHPEARLVVEFQRTLRLPFDDRSLPGLPGLGRYPLYSVQRFARRVPVDWLEHDGGMIPMYQSEAMWMSLRPEYSPSRDACYPFAVRVAVGGTDAVSGRPRRPGLDGRPGSYLVVSEPARLEGYRSEEGRHRQFVAMPLGSSYLPDGRRCPLNRFARIELLVCPLRAGCFTHHYPERRPVAPGSAASGRRPGLATSDLVVRQPTLQGLFRPDDWAIDTTERFSLRLANSLHWCAMTGSPPPVAPTRLRWTLAAADAATEPESRAASGGWVETAAELE